MGKCFGERKKEIQDIVLYRIEEKRMLLNCDLNRTVEALLIETAGNMQLGTGRFLRKCFGESKKEIEDIVLYRIEEKRMLLHCDLNRTVAA